MLDETRVLVVKILRRMNVLIKLSICGGIRANSVNLSYFIYEDGSRGAKAIRPFLGGFLGFYTTDG